MKNGSIFISGLIAALCLGAYVLYPPAHEIIDTVGHHLRDALGSLLVNGPILWEYITNNPTTSFALLITFIAFVVGGTFGRAGAHGVMTFLMFGVFVFVLWFIVPRIGPSPEQIYTLGLCLGFTVTFWLSFKMFHKPSTA